MDVLCGLWGLLGGLHGCFEVYEGLKVCKRDEDAARGVTVKVRFGFVRGDNCEGGIWVRGKLRPGEELRL
ncbi:hypothetical protein BWD121_012280 [Bartonella sp. WD12.1]|nr:hypothetical protein BWD121_012280 [Bartonella sp. WD12.1]